MDKKTYYKYIKPAAYEALEEMPMHHMFSADEFKQLVVLKCEKAKKSHVASVIRPLWDYRLSDNKKCSFVCVDSSRSMYQKISLEEWKPIEEALLKEKKEKQIKNAIQVLTENGYIIEEQR